MGISCSTSSDSHLREIGSHNALHHQQQDSTGITHMLERSHIVRDSWCVDDNELSEIGYGVGPIELQKIAVRYLKVPQPAIDTYKASTRYEKVLGV